MNAFDASAMPVFECLSNEPDFTPNGARLNSVPLDIPYPDWAGGRDR